VHAASVANLGDITVNDCLGVGSEGGRYLATTARQSRSWRRVSHCLPFDAPEENFERHSQQKSPCHALWQRATRDCVYHFIYFTYIYFPKYLRISLHISLGILNGWTRRGWPRSCHARTSWVNTLCLS
jgi:hypothetical protein